MISVYSWSKVELHVRIKKLLCNKLKKKLHGVKRSQHARHAYKIYSEIGWGKNFRKNYSIREIFLTKREWTDRLETEYASALVGWKTGSLQTYNCQTELGAFWSSLEFQTTIYFLCELHYSTWCYGMKLIALLHDYLLFDYYKDKNPFVFANLILRSVETIFFSSPRVYRL